LNPDPGEGRACGRGLGRYGEVLAWALDPDAACRTDILPRKLAYYRAYVRGWSFGGDIVIIFATLRALLRRDS